MLPPEEQGGWPGGGHSAFSAPAAQGAQGGLLAGNPRPPSANPRPALLLPSSPHRPSRFLSPCLGAFAQQFHLLIPLQIPARPGEHNSAPRPGSVLLVRATLSLRPATSARRLPPSFPWGLRGGTVGELGGCFLQGWMLPCSPHGPHPDTSLPAGHHQDSWPQMPWPSRWVRPPGPMPTQHLLQAPGSRNACSKAVGVQTPVLARCLFPSVNTAVENPPQDAGCEEASKRLRNRQPPTNDRAGTEPGTVTLHRAPA